MNMRRIFALLLLLGMLLSFQPARAQGEPSLSSAEVWIWPEYDQPGVLVILRMEVSPETALPAAMTFRIPAAAERPSAMAVGPAFDQVGDTSYTLTPDGGWVKVNVRVTAPAIQLEYYDPTLAITGKFREYNYVWPGDYAVEKLHVELQQPFDASQMKSVPALPAVNPNQNGLTYYTGDFSALKAGQTYALNVQYQKDSDALSISFVNVQSAAPLDNNTPGRIPLDAYLPWLVGVFGALMIAGGLYYYFRGYSIPRVSKRRRRSASETAAAGPTYCPQCGARARSGDRFCRTCGSRLRVEEDE
ncbi:MAG: zinc ribbon domain-containing protein [Anaerolineae bacterium CFX3]|jgi:hypothetical protein|nr:zinc ribbon domain-containing protein [Anaerolineae bacterium CFX3]MCQ3947970.1 hypothetical protein [Anaerolineae bacterium]RIK26353.1 MAG: hypothetical protein DCC54_07220 [Anaerolineae bacterium]